MPRRRACKKSGAHRYGPPVGAGGGICRSVCRGCGRVKIDLTEEELDPMAVSTLFADRDRDWMFADGADLDLLPPANSGS